MTWVATAIALLGSWLNAKKSITCFYVWVFGNCIWLAYDIMHGVYSRAALDIVQTAICIYGIVRWRRSEE